MMHGQKNIKPCICVFYSGIRRRSVTSFTRRTEALVSARRQTGELQSFSVVSGISRNLTTVRRKPLHERVGILMYFPNSIYNYICTYI